MTKVTDLTKKDFREISAKERVQIPNPEFNMGQVLGGLKIGGNDSFADGASVKDNIKKADTALDDDGNLITDIINDNLNTQTARILGEFQFQDAGAIAMKTDANNGLWLSPTGILGKKAGATTFAIDTNGNATFAGTLVAAAGTLGTITAGTLQGVTMTIGSGDSVFKATSSGIQLGHGTFSSAPFRVDMSGNLTATNATITGTITASAINSSTITGGTIKGQIEVMSSAGTVTGSLGGFQGSTFTQVVLSTGDLNSGDSFVIAQSGTTDYAGLFSGSRELVVYGGTSGTGTVEVSGANLLPRVDNSLNLGSTTKSWDNLYINDLYNGSTWLLDLNETAGMICRTKPFGLLSRSTTPGTASSYTGYMYYDTTKTTIVFSDGAGWFAVQASAY